MRSLITLGAVCSAALVFVAAAAATPSVLASGPSPFAGCTADNVTAQQLLGSTLYMKRRA